MLQIFKNPILCLNLADRLILHYLREHQKITLKQAAKTIQETDDNAHKVLTAYPASLR